jgi:hypothetical protein
MFTEILRNTSKYIPEKKKTKIERYKYEIYHK